MSNLRIGIAVIIVAVAGYVLLQRSTRPRASAHVVRVQLSDVRGMPIGAPVTLAGLRVGTVVERRIGQHAAEIDIQFESRVDLREDAVLYKRRTSLLSGPALEIDPGSSPIKLKGNYILRVEETSPIGEVLSDISEALPTVSHLSDEGLNTAEDYRAQVKGPFRESLEELEADTLALQERMHERQGRMVDGLREADQFEFDAQRSIGNRIDRADELTRRARDQLAKGRSWVHERSAEARQKVDDTKIDWSEYSDPLGDIDEGEGTLGMLVNDPSLHDDMALLTRRTKNFVRAIADWKVQVGLRNEYLIGAGSGRAYVTGKVGRSNRFYYFEVLASYQGSQPRTTLSYDPANDRFRRDVEIDSGFRLTAQWASRFGPVTFRYGIKESSFGAGTDLNAFSERLQLSADIFDLNSGDLPRLKLAASMRIFGQLYLLAGADDVLNAPSQLEIADINSEVPNRLTDIYLGRDYFLGGSIQFTDQDLAALLFIGGELFTRLAR